MKENIMSIQNHFIVNESFEEFQKTERYDSVRRENSKWLTKIEKRIQTDKENRNHLLGEIRAYATLLRLPGYRVIPTSNKHGQGADFSLENQALHSKIAVEVFTADYKPNCARCDESLRDNNISETIVTPFVNWATILAKIDPVMVSITKASIDAFGRFKDKEHQATDNHNILYVDLEGIWGTDDGQAFPLTSFGEYISSGIYWMTFYGEKGMTIYEKLNLNEPVESCTKMSHAGRFMEKTPSRFDGVMLKSYQNDGGGLVYFANPQSPFSRELEDFTIALVKSGLLNLEASCMGFGHCNLMRHVKMRNQWVKQFAKTVSMLRQ